MRPLAIVCLLLVPGALRAQGAPPDPIAEGRREFQLADQELNLGHYEKALEHLESSYRLTSRPALLYNLGYVNKQLFARTRKIDHLNRSIDLFRTFLETVKGEDPKIVEQRGKAERELKGAEEDLAREQAARAKGEEALGLGEELVQQGRLAEAQQQLDRYLRTPGNERPGVVRALQLQAAIAAAGKDTAAATDAFARALSLDKSVALPPAAPEGLRRAYTQAQLRVGDAPVLTVSHAPPGSIRPGAPIELSFGGPADPLGLLAGIVLHYRVGSGAFTALAGQPVGRIALPRLFTAALLPGARIDYYGEVLDKRGAVLQHLGAPSLPFTAQVEHLPAKSIAKKWWFWTATVGAVAAAAVALGVGLGIGLQEQRTDLPIFTGLHVK